MKAREFIKQLEEAIAASGEHDPEVVVNAPTILTGLQRVYATPLEQGEQECYVVIDITK
jgi:hypothetical protein